MQVALRTLNRKQDKMAWPNNFLNVLNVTIKKHEYYLQK
jgi:hypothetical protein